MKKKVLLMGKSGSGKTSMRSIIFSNYIARDTRRLGATIEVEHASVRFLGNLVLNLWDCGGQHSFMENYFTSQRDHIFRNVEVLIYVFDVESREIDADMEYYQMCIDAIKQNSKDAKVFCLIHKMDLVHEDLRDRIFEDRVAQIQHRSSPIQTTCFRTSIWDETLYQAWSSIVYALIPNVRLLEAHLDKFCSAADADEIILFEKTTFLVISHVSKWTTEDGSAVAAPLDSHRFEKISNIIKQFKISCMKAHAQFQAMEIRNGRVSVYLDMLTANTYLMMVVSDPDIQSRAALANIAAARRHFERLEESNIR
ncbi:small GTP-binding protein domain [Allomyces macrogynus ATCC 38327]|uniref:GTP-binding protein n=1 Tax=Allomyces macrogynus (strain ATCC 38327) TaxID=578462 RepID=A0A0L0TBQ4_ALLM3|nr:small GTP-binding protein domain [Allomyces macrogynus ATCC 38327]|eukprot:KNE72151.1 small GTP-binding protein domain [Allomyces macrogynus ATCC 38327]